ncbi:hypothetical protein AMK59_5133 [Oryctes borbonicus]|uniref:Gustatory receptor n=1 Tax=Oryctes borbonicus TaxID=1629725 RepID=A0A0T6B2R2_9SCAR|nr:hypothetical protein AMK59_5133 [Oryctes borbonicus]
MCLATCNGILMGVMIVLNIFREKYLVEGLRYLYRSRATVIQKYKSKWRYFPTCCIILAFTFLTVLTTLVLHLVNYIIRLRKISSPEFVIYAIPTFIKSLYISQFTAYIFVLYLEFKDLNQSLVKMQFVEDLSTKKIMVNLRKRHELLCLSGRSLNRGFSAQILFIIAVDFVIFVMDLYVWYVNVVDERFKRRNGHAMDTAALTAFPLYILARIVVISGICAVTKQEARRSLDLCLKIGLLHDGRVSNEINLFVQQIEHWEFGFHAMEFFKIDLTLIYSIIRSAMMFLLIFIQLDGTN